jgi:hypothetical protein
MTIQDFVDKGLTIRDSMGETIESSDQSIVFHNGLIANVIKKKIGYSIAVSDYDGYFNWNILKPNGTILCYDENEACKALSKIERLRVVS